MSTAVLDRDVVTARIERHGPIATVDEFLETLIQSVHSAAAITGEAQQLLIDSGVDPELLDPDQVAAARLKIAASVEASKRRAQMNTLSTAMVAELLATAAANIRRSIANGEIYAVGFSENGSHSIPQWQFFNGRRLPHLRQIMATLPVDMHPVEVEDFFTTAQETLRGMSPVEWLATGGSMAPVLKLATEEAHK